MSESLPINEQSESPKKMTIKLGEIFEYEIQNEEEIDKVKAFFIRVGKNYFLINIDSDDNSFCFFDKIVGMAYKGQEREGKNPFNYKECLDYLRLKKVKSTGKLVIEPPKPKKEDGVFIKTLKKKTLNSSYAKITYNWDDNPWADGPIAIADDND